MEDYITLIILIVGVFVEIAPVKINPISYLGKLLTKDLHNKVDSLEKKVDSLEKTVDHNDIDTVRNRILANETLLRKAEHFTRYQYECLFKDIDKWNNYHEEYPDLNGLLKIAIKNIEETYKQERFDK